MGRGGPRRRAVTAAGVEPTARGERSGPRWPREHPHRPCPCLRRLLFIKSIDMTESLNPPLRRRRRGIPLAALGLAALAVLGACGSDSTSSSDTTAKTDTASTAAGTTGAAATTEAPTTASSEPVDAAPRLLPQRHPRHRRSSASSKGIFAETPRRERQARDLRRSTPGPEAVEALFAGAIDATYIGPNPAINAFAKSNGEAIRIVSGATSGGAFLVVKPDINGAGRPQGQEARHPAARQHPGRRPARLAEGARASSTDTHGRRRRLDRPAGQRQTARRVQAPATSTAPGCPSRGPPAWSRRAAARSSSTSATCGRSGKFVTTHLIVAHRVPRRTTRTSSSSCSRARSTANDFINEQPGRGPDRSANDGSARSPASRSTDERDRRGVAEPDVHPRPDRRRRCKSRPRTPRTSACSSRSTSRASTT